jgi:hypothetical protein
MPALARLESRWAEDTRRGGLGVAADDLAGDGDGVLRTSSAHRSFGTAVHELSPFPGGEVDAAIDIRSRGIVGQRVDWRFGPLSLERGDWPGILLQDMRQLMADQAVASRRTRSKVSRRKIDVGASRKRVCVDRGGCLPCAPVRVDMHTTQIASKPRLEPGPHWPGQRLT